MLRDQGIEPFTRKILAIDERRPRVAVAVIHSVLGLQGEDEDPRLTMAGTRKALASRDFESRDIILKKWSEMAPPEAAVLTYDENRYEKLEQELANLDANLKEFQDAIKELSAEVKFWKSSSVEEFKKKYAIVETEEGLQLAEPRPKLEKLQGPRSQGGASLTTKRYAGCGCVTWSRNWPSLNCNCSKGSRSVRPFTTSKRS